MGDDHLDKETSVELGLTDNGVKAKAKSRTIAAIDRLGGNIVEWGNVILEAGTSRRRAKMQGEADIIAATAARAVELIGTNDEFAARALASEFGGAARKQLNKDAVGFKAGEDLLERPPSPEQTASGPETLSEEFMARFEDYAAGATTEQLRERWGRVLAGEIRAPGTFSRAVMRVIDEIDADTAAIFEKTCQSRVLNVLPKALTGKLEFHVIKQLVEVGLLIEPGLGHMMRFREVTLSDGRNIWLLPLGDVAIAFDRTKSAGANPDDPIIMDSGNLAVPIYILTSVGTAVSSILDDNSPAAIAKWIDAIKGQHPDVVTMRRSNYRAPYSVVDGEFPPLSVSEQGSN
ncbi:DUF2806 domain-containing protein [Rhizobium sp. BR 315]|uniref:DUF2806 domain-containing protein n=1 Tax=Rhizobium sp. BR 315 TaxID=3040014 RepID=UPI003D336E3A